MTPERLEELVKLGAKAVLGPNFSSTNSPYIQSIAEKNTRVTLTAVLPLIRNEVIEEVATYHDLGMVRLYLQIKENDVYRNRAGTLDLPCEANKFCTEKIKVHQSSAEAIRALKTKEPT